MTDPMRRFTDTTDGQVAARHYRSFRGPHGRDLLQVFNNLEKCGLLKHKQSARPVACVFVFHSSLFALLTSPARRVSNSLSWNA